LSVIRGSGCRGRKPWCGGIGVRCGGSGGGGSGWGGIWLLMRCGGRRLRGRDGGAVSGLGCVYRISDLWACWEGRVLVYLDTLSECLTSVYKRTRLI